MAGSGSFLLLRVFEIPLSLLTIVLFFLVWRTTRIGGFGILAALHGVYLLQMLLLSFLASGGSFPWVFNSVLSLVLHAVGAFAVWNIYTHMRRIWAPAETPPPPPA